MILDLPIKELRRRILENMFGFQFVLDKGLEELEKSSRYCLNDDDYKKFQETYERYRKILDCLSSKSLGIEFKRKNNLSMSNKEVNLEYEQRVCFVNIYRGKQRDLIESPFFSHRDYLISLR